MVVSDLNANTVWNCTVIPGGAASCTDTGATNLAQPYGMSLASSGTKALIANNLNTRSKDVTSCDYADKVLSNCVYTGAKLETTGVSAATAVIVVGNYGYYAYYNLGAQGKSTIKPARAARDAITD